VKINSTNYQNILKQYNEAKAMKPHEQKAIHNERQLESDKNTLHKQATDIQISEDYKIYERAMKELKEMDNSDDKVKAIMAQVESGEYKVSPRDIARSIIDKSTRK